MVNITDVMRYESGGMDEDEALDFFAAMIASGMVWSLQGSYGRTAAMLIEDGVISSEGRVLV